MIDLANFFLGTGIALLIALIGWSEKFSGPSKEIMELERKFISQFELKKKKVLPALRAAKEKFTFMEQIDSIIEIAENEKLEGKDIHTIEMIEDLNGRRRLLEAGYNGRYLIVISLILMCFSFGSVVLYFSLSMELVPYFLGCIAVSLIFQLLIKNREDNFIMLMNEAYDNFG